MSKISEIQTLLSVTPDGIWGPRSQAALDAAIAAGKTTPSTPHSANFTAFMSFIFEWEGETFENDPDDPGGATKFGIDQRSHAGVNIRELTKDQATEIYWKEWVSDGCADFASPYAEIYFNCAVNMGIGRAKEFDATARGVSTRFLALQEARYRSIASHGTMGKYLKGWLNRTADLRKRFSL